jgi:hypothetical protein
MKKACFQLIFWTALFWPAGWAQAGDLRYAMPVGFYPILLGGFTGFGILFIPVAIACMTVSLWAWISHVSIKAHLERAIILYMVARAAESFLMLLMGPVAQLVGSQWMTNEDCAPFVWLAAGLVVSVPAGIRLYRPWRIEKRTVIEAVCLATIAAYVSAVGTILLLHPRL